MEIESQHIKALRAADRIIAREIDAMTTQGKPIPDGFHRARLSELCPEAAAALNCFLDDRKAAAQRIDPLTCEWAVTFTYVLDPYAILASDDDNIGRDFFAWDDNSDGFVNSHDLSKEQNRLLRERIEREAGMPVLSSLALMGSSWKIMPMPSSRDFRRGAPDGSATGMSDP